MLTTALHVNKILRLSKVKVLDDKGSPIQIRILNPDVAIGDNVLFPTSKGIICAKIIKVTPGITQTDLDTEASNTLEQLKEVSTNVNLPWGFFSINCNELENLEKLNDNLVNSLEECNLNEFNSSFLDLHDKYLDVLKDYAEQAKGLCNRYY